jgi:hypothetical protein
MNYYVYLAHTAAVHCVRLWSAASHDSVQVFRQSRAVVPARSATALGTAGDATFLTTPTLGTVHVSRRAIYCIARPC